jgi:hypothetical protein
MRFLPGASAHSIMDLPALAIAAGMPLSWFDFLLL